MPKAATLETCGPGVYRDHERRISTNEKKHDDGAASRKTLHAKDEELEKKINVKTGEINQKLNKYFWVTVGFGACFSVSIGIMGAMMGAFWFVIGNEFVMKALSAIKTGG